MQSTSRAIPPTGAAVALASPEPGRKILVWMDRDDEVEILRKYLGKGGFQVVRCEGILEIVKKRARAVAIVTDSEARYRMVRIACVTWPVDLFLICDFEPTGLDPNLVLLRPLTADRILG